MNNTQIKFFRNESLIWLENDINKYLKDNRQNAVSVSIIKDGNNFIATVVVAKYRLLEV